MILLSILLICSHEASFGNGYNKPWIFLKSALQVRNSALKLKMAGEATDLLVMLQLWLLLNFQAVQGSLPN